MHSMTRQKGGTAIDQECVSVRPIAPEATQRRFLAWLTTPCQSVGIGTVVTVVD
jgi:hypothetical protein